MSKKTLAYSQGYIAGQKSAGIDTNPHDEDKQHDHWSDWADGYTDGIAEREPDVDVEDNEDEIDAYLKNEDGDDEEDDHD
jgi:hypothetical protein